MSDIFQELPEEKQMRIINAAMEVFAKNEYKKASTDDIAAKAGISKGSLFYYFRNKKSLYLYLYEYMIEIMRNGVVGDEFWEITDFFERMSYAANAKWHMINKNPYIMDFTMCCFYSQGETVSDNLNEINEEEIENAFRLYFRGVDFSKFKDSVEPIKVYRMFFWMADGFLHEKRRGKKAIEAEDIMMEFREWVDMMRQLAYKEEYLYESND